MKKEFRVKNEHKKKCVTHLYNFLNNGKIFNFKFNLEFKIDINIDSI